MTNNLIYKHKNSWYVLKSWATISITLLRSSPDTNRVHKKNIDAMHQRSPLKKMEQEKRMFRCSCLT